MARMEAGTGEVESGSRRDTPQMLLTIPQIEIALNLGRTSIYKAISKGFIREDEIVRLGRAVRIKRAAVERIACEGWGE
jgi:hypothetical protein